jgi:hypothetical protein
MDPVSPSLANEDKNQRVWQAKCLNYAAAVNTYIEKGLRDGWKKAGKEPQDSADDQLVQAALQAVRDANSSSDRSQQTRMLKERWPPMHHLLVPLLKQNGQDIPTLFLLEDGSFIARIGAPYEVGRVVHVEGDMVREVAGVEHIGRSANRRYFAMAKTDGVHITDGWQGTEICRCPWPTGLEGVPEGFGVERFEEPPTPTQLVPFPDGRRVLLVSVSGVFVLSATNATRLLPTTESMQEHFAWLKEEYPDEDTAGPSLSMQHGAISPDGKWIAVGDQDTHHLIFNDQLELVADIGPHGEYPHYSFFNTDSSAVMLNACHFYNGGTIAVRTRDFVGLKTGFYEENPKTPVVESGARVYAAAHRGDEFIIGDANGYLRAFSESGETRWQHFIGSTLCAIDVSVDGKKLVASTYAGFVTIIELDAGRKAPYQIGTGEHWELWRWLFWKEEKTPLIW